MKAIKFFILSLVFVTISSVGFAQEKSETIKVSGECGMCKKKIESSAKKAGASFAKWNAETKELRIKFDTTVTSTEKIAKSIAKTGYDTPGFKATDEDYDKLDDCCKYERKKEEN